ncbi:molecular chaperone [Motilimonas eburnea]|uniref:molecular chaperone n=1 Tax=Motilimonas eburnea TaxID=1737488 RepID=UPI001E439B22|nr:molecular chaperone [Motilimonas eburnea]MCE2572444.1 molecular chaperone [Motilimonas eburnea]
MFAGFDYGTSNCAVGVIQHKQAKLVPLSQQTPLLASTLYAPEREIILPWLAHALPASPLKTEWLKQRGPAILTAQRVQQELTLDGIDTQLHFGEAALAKYLEEPEEGYYIKSPKSFLGASGLNQVQLALFEDIVTAMFCHIKQTAEQHLADSLEQVVIGRPVNFQGLKGEQSNQQALQILTQAGHKAGFKAIEFQYEPIAAGFAFEATLDREQKVLVVDIGGGTTDISLMQMSPEYQTSSERHQHILGHSGERIGGNDFDIHFALRGLMPLFGLDSQLVTGKPMPAKTLFDAVAINDVGSQTRFYSRDNQLMLKELLKDSCVPEQLQRLMHLQQHKQSYQLVNTAEQGKKQLSEQSHYLADLGYIEAGLACELAQTTLSQASAPLLAKIQNLIDETLAQAQTQPDVIFVTGGSAKSPVITEFLRQTYPNSPLRAGDHFASVATGLTRWSQLCFS